MNHRVTHILVGIVTGVLLAATLAFAFVVTGFSRANTEGSLRRPAIPAIVHPAGGSMANCARCHPAGAGGTPRNHANYGDATCRTCHQTAPVRASRATAGSDEGVARAVPHPLAAPHDDCVGCHAIGDNLGMPAGHADFANDACIGCHDAGEPGAAEK